MRYAIKPIQRLSDCLQAAPRECDALHELGIRLQHRRQSGTFLPSMACGLLLSSAPLDWRAQQRVNS